MEFIKFNNELAQQVGKESKNMKSIKSNLRGLRTHRSQLDNQTCKFKNETFPGRYLHNSASRLHKFDN